MKNILELAATQPLDEHNRRLVENVHPLAWVDPEPFTGRYNLVVIGAGTAGLVSAAAAAGLGAKVALIERALMGGDCLNVGCVPSKALLRSARACAEARRAAAYGLRVPEVQVDFAAVMERMRRLRAQQSPQDSAERFRTLGVDLYLGDARFVATDAVEVNGRRLRFRRACIATGTRPLVPPIPDLAEAGFLTNETVFSLTELPLRLAVVGAGPIGCELAQAFARFGSEVSLIEMQERILPGDDRDAAAHIERALREDGVQILTRTKLAEVRSNGTLKRLALETKEGRSELAVDAVLLGVGRAPNVEGLELERAGVDYDRKAGVRVNERLQSTNRRVFAAGDIGFPYKFTHTADATARLVVRNALFFGRAKTSALTIPWCTYTDPELAHVGLSAEEAAARNVAIDTYTVELPEVDRAVLDGEDDGFLKVHVRHGSDRIVGATLVASHAGELISELTLAMVARAGLGTLARTIHPYPTQAEALRKAGDAYNRARLTSRVKRVLKWYFAARRRL